MYPDRNLITRIKIICNKGQSIQEILENINGVVKVTSLEPFDKKIVAELGDKCNVYHKVVLVMKYSTQVYYNIRMVLGLEISFK